VPVPEVRRFETEYLEFMRTTQGSLLGTIREEKALSDASITALKASIEEFKATFSSSKDAAPVLAAD
jgi:F-type H+-transporting ATPase subunit alpha